jgi:cytochrome c oxidase subunit II
VGRFWSFLFLLVPILGVGVFVWAMMGWYPLQGHWLPSNINAHGGVIDRLFIFILYLTGVIFIATSLALFWFMWKYDAEKNTQPVAYMHGSHALEVVWSILPAATLLFIAIYQMNAWANQKMKRPLLSTGPDKVAYTADDIPLPPLAEVAGRQFEWRIRYAGKDNIVGTPDDLQIVNDLHVPVNEEIVLAIKSQDVLQCMKQYVWFKATETGSYDIVCAELCGWGHYKMRGRITIDTKENYEKWYKQQMDEQERSSFTPPEKESDE